MKHAKQNVVLQRAVSQNIRELLMDEELKNSLRDVSQLSVLIIDNITLVHDVLKQALYGMGVREVRSAQSAYYGLRLCNEMHFHIIICSFDFQSDKDGFHLLEELKFKGYVTKTTVLIFLSAETGESLVNSIIELQPDDFWVKPLVPKHVQERLRYTLEIKRILFNVYWAMDNKEYSKAIYYAERHLLNKKLAKYHPQINRLKGEALLRLCEFSDAEVFYKQLLTQYKYSWVYTGYVKTLLKQGRIDDVNEMVEKLIKRPETRFAMHDMLAQYHIENEKYDLAYEEIKKATALSPRNIERNKKSWDLARLNHDHMGQYQATKNIAVHAKNSIHDSPEILLNVIRAGVDLATTITDGSADNLLSQTEQYIQKLESSYSDAHLFKEQVMVAQARIHIARDNNKLAERLIEAHISLKPTPRLEDNLDKVKVFHELGMREEALKLLEAIKNQISGESLTSQVVNRYVEQEMKERSDIHFTPKHLYEMAMEHLEKDRLKPAIESISQAIQLAPGNHKFSISLLKMLISSKERNEYEDSFDELAASVHNALSEKKLEGNTGQVAQELIEKWQQLTETVSSTDADG